MNKNSGKKKILIKISGEALKSHFDSSIFDKTTIFKIIEQIQVLYEQNYQIAIVVGGGNIYRGKIAKDIDLDNQTGDYMGMLATIINGVALRKIIKNFHMKCKLYSALEVSSVANSINLENMRDDYNDHILIFTGGTSEPNFTTDSAAALRAVELNCDLVLFGKNGCDGVYDKDPNLFKDATFLNRLSYDEVIQKELKVMDQTAFFLLKQANLEIRIFDILKDNAILDVIDKKIKFSVIKD